MGLFPDENINWYQKLAVMIRNRLLASAGQLLQLWRAWPISLGCHAHQHCGCALPLRLSICCQRLCKESQSHQHDSKKKHRYIYSHKNPRKNCSKLGVARDCHAQHCRDGDWLTEAPVFQNGGGSGSWHKSTRDPYFPRGESPPRHNPPCPPSGVGGKGPQDAPRGFHRFCSDLWNNINFHAAARHPPPIQEWFKCVQKRHSTTSYSISLLSG